MADLGTEGEEPGLRASGESGLGPCKENFYSSYKSEPRVRVRTQLDSVLAKYTGDSHGSCCQPWLGFWQLLS